MGCDFKSSLEHKEYLVADLSKATAESIEEAYLLRISSNYNDFVGALVEALRKLDPVELDRIIDFYDAIYKDILKGE